jgi:23S rRNA pseudouridine2605 synthase
MDSQDLEQGQEEKEMMSSSGADVEKDVVEGDTAAGVSLLFGAGVEADSESEEVVEEGSASGKEERLAKFLASAGIASRRNCEELIQEGRVTVNGEPVVSPAYNVDPAKDHVCFEGRPVESYPQGKVYILLNKPVGYTCSAKDDHAEKLVFELIPQRFGRLFTVGRLDRDSEGMLILTNDGEYAQRVMHPSRQIVKRYYVECDGQFTTSLRRRMIEGFYDNDEFLRALNVEEVNVSRGHCTLIFTLGEGRKREVRRLCKDVGLQVTLLRRIAIGALEMDDKLSAGSWRMLSEEEQQKVFEKVRLPEQAAAIDPKPYWQKEKKPFDREHRPYAASPFPEYRKREEDSSNSRDRKSFGDRDRKPFGDRDRKPFGDRDSKPFDRDRKPFDRDRKPFDRNRKPFEAEERRPWYAEDTEAQQPREERSFERKPFDRDRKPFGRKPFDKDRKPFGRKPFGRDRKPFEAEERRPWYSEDGESQQPREERSFDRKPFDRDRKPYGDRDRKPYGDRDRKPFGRKPFDKDRKPFGRKPFDRDRKPFEAEERRPWYSEDGESQQPREERSFERKSFSRDRKPFDRDRKPFDRERKPFDRDRKPFDRDRKPFGDRDRKSFGRDGERSERGGHSGFGRGAQGFRGGAHGSRPPRSWR